MSRFVSLQMKAAAKVKFATLVHPFAQMMLIDLSIQTGWVLLDLISVAGLPLQQTCKA